jgi:hypothetical protein
LNYFKLNAKFESKLELTQILTNKIEKMLFSSLKLKLKKFAPNQNFLSFKISNLKFDSNSRVQNWSLAQTSDFNP